MNITTQQIDGLAPNPAAAKNGRDLVNKGRFSNLHIDAEGSLIWGECAGSGKTPYSCSADFIQAENPVFRCSCPSRQFPCKHCIGLLYAYASGQAFAQAEVPESIASKRAKIEKRAEKKSEEKKTLKEKAAEPKKINKAAAVKKIDAQLEGLLNAGKLLENIVHAGLSSIDAKEMKNLRSRIKDLGNYHIPGIQTAFNNLVLELEAVDGEEYTHAIDALGFIAALLKKSGEYLGSRKEDPAAPPEISSEIEEQIGYVWKLTDLIPLGLYEENAELLQLSFDSYDNPARREFVDEGDWINLKNGNIYKAKSYRPYKAAKYINEEDSFMDVAVLQELYIYPGGLNPRVRWEQEALRRRPLEAADLAKVLSFAQADYASCIKGIKGSIKNPLADKHPLVLLTLNKAYMNGDNLVIEDEAGTPITLRDMPGQPVAASAALQSFLPANCKGMALFAVIDNDVAQGLFTAQPLSLVTAQKIIKLFY